MRALISLITIGFAVASMSSCTMEYNITFNDDYSGHYETYMTGGFGGMDNPYSKLMEGFGSAGHVSDDSLHVDKYITDDMPSPSDMDPFNGGFDSLMNDVSVEHLRQVPGLSNISYQWSDSTSDKMFKTSFDFADISSLNAGIASQWDKDRSKDGAGFQITGNGRKMSYKFKAPKNSQEFDEFKDSDFDLGSMEAMLSMTMIKLKFTYPKKIKRVKTDGKYKLSNNDHTVTMKHSLEDILQGGEGMTVKLRRF